MTWPGGEQGTPMHMLGRSRDLKTEADGTPVVLAEDELRAVIDPGRSITEITTDPPRPGIGRLVGAGGGRGLRAAIDEAAPEDRARHTPLALLLDDIAGGTLVGGFAWSRHRGDWRSRPASAVGPDAEQLAQMQARRRTMVGICAGFRPGSPTLNEDGTPKGDGQHVSKVPPLTDPADPIGWHALEQLPPVALRRARRMDVWRDGDHYVIDAHFRDCLSDPELVEVAVHEYSMHGLVDAATGEVTELYAVPRSLPYAECMAAYPNVDWLVGQPIGELRSKVLELLRGVDCCTHLNDALRALADVSALLALTD